MKCKKCGKEFVDNVSSAQVDIETSQSMNKLALCANCIRELGFPKNEDQLQKAKKKHDWFFGRGEKKF